MREASPFAIHAVGLSSRQGIGLTVRRACIIVARPSAGLMGTGFMREQLKLTEIKQWNGKKECIGA